MKIRTLAMVVVSVLSLSSAAALADTTTVDDGTVCFEGEAVNAVYAVDVGLIDQTVQLGQVCSARLVTAGSTSSSVGLNIQLDDCDVTMATKVSVAFSGIAIDSNNTTVLALQNSTAGGVTNVGVQILNSTDTPLTLDGATFSAATALNNGINITLSQARCYATGVAAIDTANVDTTLKMQCERGPTHAGRRSGLEGLTLYF